MHHIVLAMMNFNQNTPSAGWGVIAVVAGCCFILARLRGSG